MAGSSINTNIQVNRNPSGANKNTVSENNSSNLKTIFAKVLTKVETMRGSKPGNSPMKDEGAETSDTNKYLALLIDLMSSLAQGNSSQETSISAFRQIGNPGENQQNINVNGSGRIF